MGKELLFPTTLYPKSASELFKNPYKTGEISEQGLSCAVYSHTLPFKAQCPYEDSPEGRTLCSRCKLCEASVNRILNVFIKKPAQERGWILYPYPLPRITYKEPDDYLEKVYLLKDFRGSTYQKDITIVQGSPKGWWGFAVTTEKSSTRK